MRTIRYIVSFGPNETLGAISRNSYFPVTGSNSCKRFIFYQFGGLGPNSESFIDISCSSTIGNVALVKLIALCFTDEESSPSRSLAIIKKAITSAPAIPIPVAIAHFFLFVAEQTATRTNEPNRMVSVANHEDLVWDNTRAIETKNKAIQLMNFQTLSAL